MPKTPLYRIAHARSGDKGNRGNISLICYDAKDYSLLCEQVTEAFVTKVFLSRHPVAVKRYVLPKICAVNFVIDGLLEGGVNSSLGLDGHGKSLSSMLLAAEIDLD